MYFSARFVLFLGWSNNTLKHIKNIFKKSLKKVLTSSEKCSIIDELTSRGEQQIAHWKLNNMKFRALKSAEISLIHFEKRNS